MSVIKDTDTSARLADAFQSGARMPLTQNRPRCANGLPDGLVLGTAAAATVGSSASKAMVISPTEARIHTPEVAVGSSCSRPSSDSPSVSPRPMLPSTAAFISVPVADGKINGPSTTGRGGGGGGGEAGAGAEAEDVPLLLSRPEASSAGNGDNSTLPVNQGLRHGGRSVEHSLPSSAAWQHSDGSGTPVWFQVLGAGDGAHGWPKRSGHVVKSQEGGYWSEPLIEARAGIVIERPPGDRTSSVLGIEHSLGDRTSSWG